MYCYSIVLRSSVVLELCDGGYSVLQNFFFIVMQIDHKGSEQVLGDTFRRYIQSIASCLIWLVPLKSLLLTHNDTVIPNLWGSI